MSSTLVSTAAEERPLWRTYLAFVGPMVLANMLQSMSGTINGVFVGQMLGTQAVAAVAGLFPIVFFFIALVIGIGAGASVLIGQAWGAREFHKVKAIGGTALAVALILGVLVALFGGMFTKAMLHALGTPADIEQIALGYARVMMFTMPALLVFLCWFMLRRKHPLAPDREMLRALRIDPKILRLVVRIGLPTGVQMIVVSLAEIAILSLVNRFGSDATAAFGAVNQVVNYVQFPALSIGITASILGAQAIGAGHTGRLGDITRTGLKITLVITGGLVLLGYLFSRHLIGLFITSQPVIELAQTLLHIMLWGMLLFGLSTVVGGVMRSSGAVLVPTAISIFCVAGLEVPAAWLLGNQIGINGVWMAYPIAFAGMLVLQSAYYRLVWRKQEIRRLV